MISGYYVDIYMKNVLGTVSLPLRHIKISRFRGLQSPKNIGEMWGSKPFISGIGKPVRKHETNDGLLVFQTITFPEI